MEYIDTHTHLYMEAFSLDLNEVIQNAIEAGVSTMIMPNVDVDSLPKLLNLKAIYPQHLELCLGLHPTNVDKDYLTQLEVIHNSFDGTECGVGEIGIDLYHSSEFLKEQQMVFETQLQWAVDKNLPVALHVRSAFPEVFYILANFPTIKGVFHCFSGGIEEAKKIMTGDQFYFGIGGVATFKNAKLLQVLKSAVPVERVILETDAPYLAPTPFRGQRNESKFIPLIAQTLSDTYEIPLEELALITTRNAKYLFGI